MAPPTAQRHATLGAGGFELFACDFTWLSPVSQLDEDTRITDKSRGPQSDNWSPMGRPSKKPPANLTRNARTLGENVRRLRQLAELSQEGLAEAADLRQALISEIERGEANPRLASLTKIADALKVRLTDLFNQDR